MLVTHHRTVPVLATTLVIFTLLSMGPLLPLDRALHFPGWKLLPPNVVAVLDVLDHLAGQAVLFPLLMSVALVLAWRRRSWRPLGLAVGAEVLFYGFIGVSKVLFSRPYPKLEDERFFQGGLLSEDGFYGISYPSGHTAEAVLIYGTIALLLFRYTRWGASHPVFLEVAVVTIAATATTVAYLLGWHWPTDLVGGLLFGALSLRILIDADRYWSATRATGRARVAPNSDGYRRIVQGDRQRARIDQDSQSNFGETAE